MPKKKWLEILKKIAPVAATAIGGPFAGLAVKALGKAVGDENATEETLATLIEGGDSEVLVKLKEGEQAFKVKMKELDIREEDLAYKDIASAREMQMHTKEKTPAVLAAVVLVLFGGLTGTILWGMISESFVMGVVEEKFVFFLFGAVISWVTQIIAFYYGSSKGSMMKTIEMTRALRGYIQNGNNE